MRIKKITAILLVLSLIISSAPFAYAENISIPIQDGTLLTETSDNGLSDGIPDVSLSEDLPSENAACADPYAETEISADTVSESSVSENVSSGNEITVSEPAVSGTQAVDMPKAYVFWYRADDASMTPLSECRVHTGETIHLREAVMYASGKAERITGKFNANALQYSDSLNPCILTLSSNAKAGSTYNSYAGGTDNDDWKDIVKRDYDIFNAKNYAGTMDSYFQNNINSYPFGFQWDYFDEMMNNTDDIYLTGKNAQAEGTYYLRCTPTFYNQEVEKGLYVGQVTIPVIVEADGTGTVYPAPATESSDGILFDTLSEAEEHIREGIIKKDTSVYALFPESGLPSGFDENDYKNNLGWLYSITDFGSDRADMKFYEGDYLGESFLNYGLSETGFGEISVGAYPDNKKYYFLQVSIPQAQYAVSASSNEARLISDIDALFTSGQLKDCTRSAGKYSEAAIVKKLMNFVQNKVTWVNGGSSYYLHSAYSAYYDGKGSCQAYAQLFYLLLRRAGFSNKILMGTDSGAHTYNIVQMANGCYYYCDASNESGSVFLKGSSTFKPATLQSRYQNASFAGNFTDYLSYYDYPGTYSGNMLLHVDRTVSGNVTDSLGDYPSAATADKAIIKDHAENISANACYTVSLLKGATMSNALFADLNAAGICYSLKLNGNILKFSSDTVLNGNVSGPGSLVIPNGSTLSAAPSVNGILWQNVTVNSATASSAVVFGAKDITAENYSGTVDTRIKPVSLNNVDINRATVIALFGKTDADENCSFACQSGMSGYEAVTPNKFSAVDGENYIMSGISSDSMYPRMLGKVTVNSSSLDDGNAKIMGTGIIGDISAAGKVKLDHADLFLTGAFSAKKGICYSTNDFSQSTIRLHLAAINDGVRGSLNIGGKITTDNTYGLALEKFSAVIYKTDISITGSDCIFEDRAFSSGDTVAVLGKSVEYDTIRLSDASLTLKKTGNALKVYLPCVMIIKDNISKTYSTLEEAAAGITSKNDFNSASGSYSFIFTAGASLDRDVKIPACVNDAVFTTLESANSARGYESRALNLNGHRLSFSGKGTAKLCGGLQLANNSAKPAIFNLSAKGSTLSLSPSNNAANTVIVGKVNITGSKSTIELNASGLNTEYFSRITGMLNAGTVRVNSGRWYIGTIKGGSLSNSSSAELQIGLLSAPALFDNFGRVYINSSSNISKFDNRTGASAAADSFMMKSNGKLYLGSGSSLYIRSKAQLCGINTGAAADGSADAGTAPAMLYRAAKTKISINGRPLFGSCSITFASLSENSWNNTGVIFDNPPACSDTAKCTTLFSTNQKNFPLEKISLSQCSSAGEKYKTLTQIGTSVRVTAADWIHILKKDESGADIELKAFTRWSEAAAYVNGLKDKSSDYIFLINEGLETSEKLTLPNYAASVEIRGAGSADPTLTFIGDINLATDLKLYNVRCSSVVFDKKADEYITNPKENVKLNGHCLTLENAQLANSLSSLGGSGKSALAVINSDGLADNDQLNVKGKITAKNISITGTASDNAVISAAKGFSASGTLTSRNAKIKTDGSLNSGKDAYLQNTSIYAAANLTFKNLHSLDDQNSLTYAAGAKNKLTVKGISDALDISGNNTGTDIAVSVNGTANVSADNINRNALDISVIYIENAKIADNVDDEGKGTCYGKDNYIMKDYKYDPRAKKYTLRTDYSSRILVAGRSLSASFFAIDRSVSNGIASVHFLTEKNRSGLTVRKSE